MSLPLDIRPLRGLAFLVCAAVGTAVCTGVAGCNSADEGPPPRAVQSATRRASDSSAIRAAIERGARGFMRGDPDSILAHYARDVVLSYPATPDMGYDTLAKGYAGLRDRPASVTATTVPTFDEIMVHGDLAVVRLRWQTTIVTAASDTAPRRESVRWLKDLQVWRRDPEGWRFVRGMHYPDSTVRR